MPTVGEGSGGRRGLWLRKKQAQFSDQGRVTMSTGRCHSPTNVSTASLAQGFKASGSSGRPGGWQLGASRWLAVRGVKVDGSSGHQGGWQFGASRWMAARGIKVDGSSELQDGWQLGASRWLAGPEP
eukprot:361760-Chlamydomonas_euryale.AAC.5